MGNDSKTTYQTGTAKAVAGDLSFLVLFSTIPESLRDSPVNNELIRDSTIPESLRDSPVNNELIRDSTIPESLRDSPVNNELTRDSTILNRYPIGGSVMNDSKFHQQ